MSFKGVGITDAFTFFTRSRDVIKCIPGSRDVINPYFKKSLNTLNILTTLKNETLQANGFNVQECWECEFDKILSSNGLMKEIHSNTTIPPPLEVRDSFYGGRTQSIRLYCKAEGPEKIHYVDFTSLYPYCLKYRRYPCGYPVVIHRDFKDLHEYFGFIHLKILPPKGLFLPVLPSRHDGKLFFSLCTKCSESQNKGLCNCSDQERCITGTYCTEEVKLAVRKGYKILEIFEVHHFPQTAMYDPATKRGGLFTQYVNTFLKKKQSSSGWPSWCKSDLDKEEYIRRYLEEEGISLDPDEIAANPPMRSISNCS